MAGELIYAFRIMRLPLLDAGGAVIGRLDDIVVIALALRYAGSQVPREVFLDAWPGNPSLINRLLGPARISDA